MEHVEIWHTERGTDRSKCCRHRRNPVVCFPIAYRQRADHQRGCHRVRTPGSPAHWQAPRQAARAPGWHRHAGSSHSPRTRIPACRRVRLPVWPALVLPPAQHIGAGTAADAEIVAGQVYPVPATRGAGAADPAEARIVAVPLTKLSPKKHTRMGKTMLHPPVSGTNATGMMLRLDTAASASLVISTSSWSPWGGPTGITMRPPGRSCSTSAGGTWRGGLTMIASNGARSGQPKLPRRCAIRRCRNPAPPGFRGAGGKSGDHFDRADPVGKRDKHRCLIAGAGAHLQYGIIWPEIEQFRHQRDDEGLRNRLAMTDRQRPVLIGRALRAGRTNASRRTVASAPATLGDSAARPVQRAVSRIPSAICSISAARASSGCSMPPTLPVARPAV